MTFGYMLRKYRMAKNISLRQVAKRIGMDSGNYSKVESGEFGPFGHEKLESFAKVVGLPSSDLEAMKDRAIYELTERARARYYARY